jgi:hypothetical protein
MRASPPTADAGVRRALRSLGRSDGVAQSDGRRRADGVSGLRLGSLVFSVWLVKAVADDGPAASVDNQPRDWLRRFEGYPSGHRPSPGIMPRLGRTPHTFQPAPRRLQATRQFLAGNGAVYLGPGYQAHGHRTQMSINPPHLERLGLLLPGGTTRTARRTFATAMGRNVSHHRISTLCRCFSPFYPP